MVRAKTLLGSTGVTFAALVLTGFALAHPGEANPARSRHVVEIRGLQFQPAELTVMPGDTVEWINRDIVPHTATALNAEWSSGELKRDQSWQLIVMTSGTYQFYCKYHPTMRGKLIERSVYQLAYLHIVRPRIPETEGEVWDDSEAQSIMQLIRDRYKGTLIVAGGFDLEEAEEWIENGRADLIAFGRKFLANPDLPERFRLGAALNEDDPTTYYGGSAKGYTDYPSLQQTRGEIPMPCVDQRWR